MTNSEPPPEFVFSETESPPVVAVITDNGRVIQRPFCHGASMSRQEMVDFIPSTGMGRFTRLTAPERLPDNLGIAYDELARER